MGDESDAVNEMHVEHEAASYMKQPKQKREPEPEQLKPIVPGKTYPTFVKVTEKNGDVAEFQMNSFYVGMYCAIYFNGNLAGQSGDHNNTTFCRKLKKDLKAAIARGAKVEVGSIRKCQLEMPK